MSRLAKLCIHHQDHYLWFDVPSTQEPLDNSNESLGIIIDIRDSAGILE